MKKQNFELLTIDQSLFLLFCIIVVSVCINFKQPILSILITPFIISIFINKWNLKQIIIVSLISLIYFLIYYFIKINATISQLNYLLINKTNFYIVRIKAINYINSIYNSEEVSGFFKLLILNYKDSSNYVLYKQINNLSIGFLFVVSGFHINLILNVLKYIFRFKSQSWTWFVLSLLFCNVYGYFLGFSIGILRIILNIVIRKINKKLDSLKVSCLSGILISVIFLGQASNFGFIMTYLCSIYINILTKHVKNKIILTLLINVGCFLIVLPIVLVMSHKLNIFSIFLNYVYSILIPPIYFWLLIFGWIPPLSTTNTLIITNLLKLINLNIKTGTFLYVKSLKIGFVIGFYMFCSILLNIYLIKNNSRKIIFFAPNSKNSVY